MPDTAVKTGSAELKDYKGSGYDRGHLCPAGDMSFDSIAMRESFLMSNMSPQLPGFNRGIWNSLEQKIRNWGLLRYAIYNSGPIFYDTFTTAWRKQCSYPRCLLQSCSWQKDNEYHSIGF